MLRSVDNLIGFSLGASDGEIGRVHSFLFDYGDWAIHYLVVDTGRWLPGRKVLIPTKVLDQPDWQDRVFRVDLTKEQVRDSPQIDAEAPVSRQREIELHEHYGWVPYWGPVHGLAVAPEHQPQHKQSRGRPSSSRRGRNRVSAARGRSKATTSMPRTVRSATWKTSL